MQRLLDLKIDTTELITKNVDFLDKGDRVKVRSFLVFQEMKYSVIKT